LIRSLFSRARNPEERRVRAWCRQTLGITPGDLPLYRQALRHVSAVSDERPDLPDNERLEFLGDAVLDAIIGGLLFTTYPEKGEGFLTRMRSKLVSRSQLNILAKHVQIERVMESNIARGHESSVPGNALEALIGAIFLDKGFERTRKVVVDLIHAHFDLKEIEKEDRDGKSRLLEWGQKRRKRVEFVVKEEGGRGRGKVYVAEVHINGEVKGVGKGTSKKVAEQEAAQSAFGSMRSRKPQTPRPEPRHAHHEEEAQQPEEEAARSRRRRGPRRRPASGGKDQPAAS
jgi:ribonuclease-3